MDTVLSQFDSVYPDLVEERLECQTKLFRSQYAITVSSSFAKELIKTLEKFVTFTEQEMTDENILQQYEFLWIIGLTHRFILALNRLNLEIREVIEEQALRNQLNDLVVKITTGLSEEGLKNVKLNGKENR